MRLRHDSPVVRASFDDPNLVSCGGVGGWLGGWGVGVVAVVGAVRGEVVVGLALGVAVVAGVGLVTEVGGDWLLGRRYVRRKRGVLFGHAKVKGTAVRVSRFNLL